MARHFALTLPPEVESFFDLAEAGDWNELASAFGKMRDQLQSGRGSEALSRLWAPLTEMYGVADIAHHWPAAQLLDYGETILRSIPPGAIYLGGTDAGRFIPTLLNETQDGEKFVVLTQNAFADNSYLEYSRFLYGDALALPSPRDSERIFGDYMSDLQNRALHDQQAPNEPRQVRPGEDVHMEEGRVTVGGQVAVMAINERLLARMLEQNPDRRFTMEESFPLTDTYADAAPLGPLLELRAQNVPDSKAQRAVDSLNLLAAQKQRILAEPSVENSQKVRDAWAKLASAQGGLLKQHGALEEAERAFQLALELAPANSEAVFRHVQLLAEQHRFDEATAIARAAADLDAQNPVFHQLVASIRQLAREPSPPPAP
jgi:hypothetical protein